jgi:cytochrome c biogenesis protein CcmG/thiol:disulfide interchange protein DsbE
MTMRTHHRSLAVAAVVAALVAACAQPPATEPEPAGSTAPPGPAKAATQAAADAVHVRFAGFAGGPGFALPEDLAGRPLVLNVWASWCIPCRKEMPAFQSVYAQARGTVGFLGVDFLDEEGAARRLVADTKVTYPLAADPKGTQVTKFGVTALPTTLFFSADGVLRGRSFGELSADQLRAAIRRYLGLELP